jgi:type IV pilus assembly protein PilA
MKKMDNKGFSLVELIVVIAIMAVLMGVLAPTLLGNVEKSKLSKDKSSTDTLYTAFTNTAGDADVSSKVVGDEYVYEVEADTDNNYYIDVTSPKTGTLDTAAADMVKDYVGADKIYYTSKGYKAGAKIHVKVAASGKVAIYAECVGGTKTDFYVNCADSKAWGNITVTE